VHTDMSVNVWLRKRVAAFADASGNALCAFADTSMNAEIEMLKI